MPPSAHNESDLAERLLAEAIAHHQAGRLAEAERLYLATINTAPQNLSAHYRLGVLYFQNGRAAQALSCLEAALKLQPDNPGILNTLGVALQNNGRGAEALARLQQAQALRPDDASILGNLARALQENGDMNAALACYDSAIRIDTANPAFIVAAGRCHYEAGRFDDAIAYFEKALTQKPDDIDALTALGGTYWAQGNRARAHEIFDHAQRAAPNEARTSLNFGEFLYDEGKIDKALVQFDRARALSPNHPAALWRKSFALLAKGHYREGWKLYAESLGNRELRGPNLFAPQPPWDGKPAPGKHLLIWCEQGLGDSLQFIRYAALCKERVGKVSVFCQKPLVRLFASLPFIDHASDTCDRTGFDEHVPMMNLPHLFDTTLETVPAAIPYLQIDAATEAKGAARLAGHDDKLKVGLVWAGGTHKGDIISKMTDLQRSIGLELMRPWLDIPGLAFYSLQKDEPARQIDALGLRDRLIDPMGEVADFADTAAIVQALDLIITVDTSVAHLAGGMGKPVWILSRYNADWRWLQNRPENPWYPTARVFGQPRLGDWATVVTAVEQALRAKAAG